MMRLRSKNNILLLFMALVIGYACDDIIEKDISTSEVILRSPSDGVELKDNNVTFWWEHLDGSRFYELQVVTPSFDKPDVLVLDTVVETNQLTFKMPNGTFQWAVSAFNNGYATPFSFRNLTVLSDSSTLSLSTPAEGFVTADTVIDFQWNHVSSDKYIFEIIDHSEYDEILAANTTSKSFPREDAVYEWQVSAISGSDLVKSSLWSFRIDATAPGVPLLLEPEAGDTIAIGAEFTWTRNGDEDIKYDSFLLFDDSLTTTPVSDYPLELQDSSFVLTSSDGLTVGKSYFWSVYSVDSVGNVGEESERRRFLFQ